ncbi:MULTISPECIES: hypothetical protein [unclassified Wolbachia]|uniref:hypothetical protein n=1 Tax=unclassified Wolbachia TaxID=2640676 RepID=UPI002230EF04|nr:hypothetical protein [Wolbachia endosymbiont (group A) of Apoderus coryli]
MHGNNDKESRGNRVIPSDRFERVGPDKHEREARQRERESSKPSSQLGSSSTTGADSNKSKSK